MNTILGNGITAMYSQKHLLRIISFNMYGWHLLGVSDQHKQLKIILVPTTFICLAFYVFKLMTFIGTILFENNGQELPRNVFQRIKNVGNTFRKNWVRLIWVLLKGNKWMPKSQAITFEERNTIGISISIEGSKQDKYSKITLLEWLGH